MSDGFEIDLDGEQILFDGTWYSKEELARKIRTMVDAGDYRISRPSAALEALQNALGSLRTLTIRLPLDLADAIAAAAAQTGQPIRAYVRDALVRVQEPAQAPPVVLMQVPAPSGVSGSPSPASGAPVPVTEPASADEAAGAIPLIPKRREETDVERAGSAADNDARLLRAPPRAVGGGLGRRPRLRASDRLSHHRHAGDPESSRRLADAAGPAGADPADPLLARRLTPRLLRLRLAGRCRLLLRRHLVDPRGHAHVRRDPDLPHGPDPLTAHRLHLALLGSGLPRRPQDPGGVPRAPAVADAPDGLRRGGDRAQLPVQRISGRTSATC